jgi:hypothetical protein
VIREMMVSIYLFLLSIAYDGDPVCLV